VFIRAAVDFIFTVNLLNMLPALNILIISHTKMKKDISEKVLKTANGIINHVFKPNLVQIDIIIRVYGAFSMFHLLAMKLGINIYDVKADRNEIYEGKLQTILVGIIKEF
jgi:hypothetical protein